MPARNWFWNYHLQYSKMQKCSSPLCWARWWGLVLPSRPLSPTEGLTSSGWPGRGPRDGSQVTRLAQRMLSLLRYLADPIAFISILWGVVVLLWSAVSFCSSGWPQTPGNTPAPAFELPTLWAWMAMPSNFINFQRSTTLGWQRRLSYTSLAIQYWSLEPMWKAGWQIP